MDKVYLYIRGIDNTLHLYLYGKLHVDIRYPIEDELDLSIGDLLKVVTGHE